MPTQTGFGYGRSCVPPEPLVRGAAGPVEAGFSILPSVTRAATRMEGAYTNRRLTSRYIAKAVNRNSQIALVPSVRVAIRAPCGIWNMVTAAAWYHKAFPGC